MSLSGKNPIWNDPAICQRATDMLQAGSQISAMAIALSSELRVRLTYRMAYAWVESHHPEFITKRTMQPIKRPTFGPLPPAGAKANKLKTVFLRKRKDIPAETRTANVNALLGAARKMANIAPHVSADFRHQAALWAHSETSFAAYDVEAANPLTAAADGRPYNWGADRQPSLVLGVSALGAASGSM